MSDLMHFSAGNGELGDRRLRFGGWSLRCLVRAHPHPNPLPQAGEGAGCRQQIEPGPEPAAKVLALAPTPALPQRGRERETGCRRSQ